MIGNKLVVGICAHVDAGKTTLSESMLFATKTIRKLGRVDHGDAFLDTFLLERQRGITIFSKQAVMPLADKEITLLDTPGHVDFSAEMERTLQVMDYAILVISGADGVQGHTRTLWKLLSVYHIPTFLFVNKMDQEGTDAVHLAYELSERLSEGCITFHGLTPDPSMLENLALSDEEAMEEYLEKETLADNTLRRLIRERKAFPVFYGSALKMEGVDAFLKGLDHYTTMPFYPKEFGAKVFKIARDEQGNRLTYMKITGGVLKVKDQILEDKVHQIRIYSGGKYETVSDAPAGTVCAVTGLTDTTPGEGLGIESKTTAPILSPVLSYRIHFPEGTDQFHMLENLRQLEEEEPTLKILWNEETGDIRAQLMGEIQMEILRQVIADRFGVICDFDTGSIVYKETIAETVEGVGHYEPLRHYAEVHLILEPGEPGSGLVLGTECSEDDLDKNWQRLILTHLAEKEHRGVLTGAAITDMKIMLAAGRAHLKHTEGGDFREATYRAVRQGLMQAKTILLEPYYQFVLEIPAGQVGRAMTDIQRMNGTFDPPETVGDQAVITGNAPVSMMQNYPMEVISYTRGQGRIFCSLKGYAPCIEQEKVAEATGYDPEADTDNPTGSIFCSHGAGYYVPWNEVFSHMHLESQLKKRKRERKGFTVQKPGSGRFSLADKSAPSLGSAWNQKEEKELEDIFIRTYGKIERKNPPGSAARKVEAENYSGKKEEPGPQFLLVDGYNVIHAWEDMADLAAENLEAARSKLMDVLCNYQGYKGGYLILVFDAYKADREELEILKYHNIYVVFTKNAETADQYIEKVVHNIGKKKTVTVVTSDGVEQVITAGQGAKLVSAREFREEIRIVGQKIREEFEARKQSGKNYLFDYLDEELAREMEEVRLGRS